MNQKFITKDGHTTSVDNINAYCIDAEGHFQHLTDGKRFLTVGGRTNKVSIKPSVLTLHEAVSLMVKQGGTITFDVSGGFTPLSEKDENGNYWTDGEVHYSFQSRAYSLRNPIESYITADTRKMALDGIESYLITGTNNDAYSTIDAQGSANLGFAGTSDAPTFLMYTSGKFKVNEDGEMIYIEKYRSNFVEAGVIRNVTYSPEFVASI